MFRFILHIMLFCCFMNTIFLLYCFCYESLWTFIFCLQKIVLYSYYVDVLLGLWYMLMCCTVKIDIIDGIKNGSSIINAIDDQEEISFRIRKSVDTEGEINKQYSRFPCISQKYNFYSSQNMHKRYTQLTWKWGKNVLNEKRIWILWFMHTEYS